MISDLLNPRRGTTMKFAQLTMLAGVLAVGGLGSGVGAARAQVAGGGSPAAKPGYVTYPVAPAYRGGYFGYGRAPAPSRPGVGTRPDRDWSTGRDVPLAKFWMRPLPRS